MSSSLWGIAKEVINMTCNRMYFFQIQVLGNGAKEIKSDVCNI